MAGSPPKKLRMFEDDIDYDDIDIESESGGESDSDNEEDILEVDDHEGKELLKNFLEMNSPGAWNELVTGMKGAAVQNDKSPRSSETNLNSVAVTDFVLDDVKKVNEENLRLLEEVQEMGDELREKNKMIEQLREIMEVSVEKIKELKQKEEDLKILQTQNSVLQESLKTKDEEMVSLKSQLRMYDMLSSNWKKSATETAAETKKINATLQEREKDVTTLKSILNELELSCQAKLEKEQDNSLALKENYMKFADEYERKAEQMLNMITLQNEAIKRLKLKDRHPTDKEGERMREVESGDETNTKETNKRPSSTTILSRPQNLFLVGPPGPPSTSTKPPGPPSSSSRPPGPLSLSNRPPGSTSTRGPPGPPTPVVPVPGPTKNLIGPPGPFIVSRSKSPPGPSAINV